MYSFHYFRVKIYSFQFFKCKCVYIIVVCSLKQRIISQYSSIVKNSISRIHFSFFLHFHNHWMTFYNFTLKRPNFTHINSEFLWLTWSFKTVSHNHLLTISVNKSIFFGSKMGQTQH